MIIDFSKVGTMLHWAYVSGNDDAYLPGRSTVYPGDWEEIEPTYQTYSICSVDASPSFMNTGISYPDVNNLNCPTGYKPKKLGCYRVVTLEKTFDEAQKFCEDEGTKNNWPKENTAGLASIYNDIDDLFLYSMLYESFHYAVNDDSKSIWLGMVVNGEEFHSKILVEKKSESVKN